MKRKPHTLRAPTPPPHTHAHTRTRTPGKVTRRDDGANGCTYGVFSAAVAYDKWVGRYMISAICDDLLEPKILLAVSVVDSVTDYWSLYSVPARNTVRGRL